MHVPFWRVKLLETLNKLTVSPYCLYDWGCKRKERFSLITEERIERLIEQYAVYADADHAFLPVFERLESERAKVRSKGSALERARAIAAGQKEIGLSKVAA